MAKVVLALGGNALGNTPSKQKEATLIAAEAIVELAKKGYQVVVCHGNGPQVGAINNAFEKATELKMMPELMPFAECGAMSQGYIGYHLQNAIKQVLHKNKMTNNVGTIVTQTIIDSNDVAFKNPTKPIGGFMTEDVAQALAKETGVTVVEDSGRGWRRVVPSPKPIGFVEEDIIKLLVQNNVITIAGGGGGVPVYQEQDKLIGVDAVIDKDLSSAKLAELIDTEYLIILTAVNQIKVNYNKPNEESISEINLADLQKHIDDEQFAPGSMLPKVEAVRSFVMSTGKPGYIGELKDAQEIIAGTAGTKIIK